MHETRDRYAALLAFLCFVTTALACTGPPEGPPPNRRTTGAAHAEFDIGGVTVVLPMGDSQAGRQAFLDLKCTVCHRVAGETAFPMPVSDTQGPDLDHTLGLRPRSELASSIILPSHSMSLKTSDDVKTRLEGTLLSPMGDFSRTITVRQLADLIEYLGSLETAKR
jgi:hypothetical protein